MRVRQRLVDRLVGAATYRGGPPLWLVSEGLVVAAVGTALVVGAGGFVVLAGLSPIRSAAVIAVAVAAVVLYLLITRAGRVLVAGIAVLGALLAPDVSRLTAEAVLFGAGRTQDVVVTAVAHEPSGGPAYSCAVRRQDGAHVQRRLRRGCGPAVVPGDLIAMVYDPAGRVAPRGLAGPGPLVRAAAEAVLLALVFAAVCLLAVVRSYRKPSTGSDQPRG